MTPLFVEDFYDRKRQVRHYLAVVQQIERSVTLGSPTPARERRLLTLRAGTFLLLYNLIEASTRNAIEAIHDDISTNNVEFEALAQPLRSEMVRRFKQGAKPETHHAMRNLPAAFVGIALDQGVSMSGNVDAKFIRELSEVYGFSIACDKDKTWNGADLVKIKYNRNELAHGRKTFEEVGRDYTGRDLIDLARRSLTFIHSILENITEYIFHQAYLEPILSSKPIFIRRRLPLYRKIQRRGYRWPRR